MFRRALLSLAFAFTVSYGGDSLADPQSRSWSSWTITTQGLSATFTLPVRDAALLAPATHALQLARPVSGEIRARLSIDTGTGDCAQQSISQQRARDGYLRFQIEWRCPGAFVSVRIKNQVLQQLAPSHMHFARIRLPDGTEVERLFSRGNTVQTIALQAAADSQATGAGGVWPGYTRFGFEHILIGIDHIAFLLGLMLLTRRLRDVIVVVTGFTLGHSITLALTSLGLLNPEQALVEGLIGYTIALVALDNTLTGKGDHLFAAMLCGVMFMALAGLSLLGGVGPPPVLLSGIALLTFCYLQLGQNPQQSRKLRPALTLLFGLIHGFGFAGVLLEVGLPRDSVVAALLAFNIGVELGQLAIVLALAGTIRVLTQIPRWWSTIDTTVNAGLCGLGVFWFVQRLY